MPKIGKILFPVDFSESCVGAARYVEFFAGEFEAEIMLLHAVGMGEHALPEDLLPLRKAQLEAFMADEFRYFSTQRVCTIEQDPAWAIVEAARSFEPDLVMLPTHGLGFFRRHLLGSVTAKTLHDMDCPVWTSVHAEAAPPLQKIHCRRILCAVSLDSGSGGVLQWAEWLARQCDAALGIIYATAGIDAAVASRNLEEEYNRQVSAEAKKQIDALLAGAGATAEVFILPGKPEAVVAEAAAQFNADLVVIGRHGGSGLGANLFQHAYAILRGAPCPVVSI